MTFEARRRSVRLLAVARFASTGGSQAAQIALAYTVYERTSSAAWVSASLIASAGIVGLIGPISGRLSDRFDRRRVMVSAEIAGAIGWLAVLMAGSTTMLILTALIATASNAPFRAASSASIPNLVAPDQLSWANGAVATAVNASMIVGPLVGGTLVGAAGPRAVFGLNVASFLMSALLIWRIPGEFSEARGSAPRGAGPSWRDVLRDRRKVGLFAMNALTFGSFGIILVADLPLVDHFNGGAVGYMLLTTLWGIGAVVGSTSAARLPVHREYHALVIGTAAMAISIGSIAFMPNLFGAIAVGTLGGIGSGLAFTPWFSLLQRATADSQRGTAFAMADTFEQSSFIAGMVVAGWAVGFLGPRTVYLLPAALLLVAMTIALRQGSPKAAAVMTNSPYAGFSTTTTNANPD